MLVAEDSSVKRVPKTGSVFDCIVAGSCLKIFGSHFCYRSADRSSRKLKGKASIEL